MSDYCLMFSGQSIQAPGMGRTLLSRKSVREYLEALCDAFDRDVLYLLDGAGADELGETRNSQLAIHAHHLGCLYWLRERNPSIQLNGTIGHSLGVVAALVAAGAISDTDSAKFVRSRADAFHRACQTDAAASGLLAVSSQDLDEFAEDLCTVGDVTWALRNTNSRGVLGGTIADLEQCQERAASQRWRVKFQRLNVQGAFHTPAFSQVKSDLTHALEGITIAKPRCPVFMGTSGRRETQPNRIRQLLIDQADHLENHLEAVWDSYDAGCRQYLEVGFKVEPVHWLVDQLTDEDDQLLSEVKVHRVSLDSNQDLQLP